MTRVLVRGEVRDASAADLESGADDVEGVEGGDGGESGDGSGGGVLPLRGFGVGRRHREAVEDGWSEACAN